MVVAFVDIDLSEELGNFLLPSPIDVFLQGGLHCRSFAAVISDFHRFFEQFLCDIKIGSHVQNICTISRTIKPYCLRLITIDAYLDDVICVEDKSSTVAKSGLQGS